MVKALLGRIENLFQPDFLFASFLPTLLFVTCNALILGDVLGFKSVIALASSWTTEQSATVIASTAFGTVVLAYVMYGLRSWFLRLWGGTIEGPFKWYFAAGQRFYGKRYRELRDETYQEPKWNTTITTFREAVRQDRKTSGQSIPQDTRDTLLKEIKSLYKEMGEHKVQITIDKVINAYSVYCGENLNDVHLALIKLLRDWTEQEEMEKARRLADLDRRFGGSSSIRPTALGNVVESYNSYPFKRYGIEGEVFWPHLEHVMEKEYLERIREVRILLDFFLTSATLGILTAILSVLVGPWIMLAPWYWNGIGIAAVIISYNLYYKMAVFIAIQYGDLVRAGFDIFRIKLLISLGCPAPIDRSDELARWKQLSQLLVFGHAENYTYKTTW